MGPAHTAKLKGCSIVVGGENFGLGSARSRPECHEGAGVRRSSPSPWRIFYRNTLNVGIAAIECPEAVEAIGEGDRIVSTWGKAPSKPAAIPSVSLFSRPIHGPAPCRRYGSAAKKDLGLP